MYDESKKWYKSWTIWFNVALVVIDFINALAQVIPIPPGILSAVGSVGNILLRFKTSLPIK